jgi:hypothetical protein
MLTDPEVKAISDTLRNLYRRLVGGEPVTPKPIEPKPRTQEQREQIAAVEKMAKYRQVFNDRMADLGKRLADGEITPREFRAYALIEIRYSILTGAAIGAGGVGMLRPEDIQRVDAKVREQARYLDNWIAQLERTDQRSAPTIITRAQMYGNAAEEFMHDTIDKSRYRDLPNMPFQPKDRTRCDGGCKCRWDWIILDREKGDADVYWRLGEAEHCITCVRRADTFKPLRIRNFQIENLPADMTPFIYSGR